MKSMKYFGCLTALSLMLTAGGTWAAEAVEVVTAKKAVALGNDFLDTKLKDQVVLIEGSESDISLKPRVWTITYFDATRVNNGAVVRVKDGAATSLGSSVRLFDDARWKNFGRNFSGYQAAEVISMSKWALDSDQVLAKVLAHPRLQGLQVTRTTMLLRKLSDGDVAPVWIVKIRARDKDDAAHERWVGYVHYSADTGEAIKEDLAVK